MAGTGTQEIRTALADGVLEIALARAAKKNALTRPMYAALAATLRAAGEDAAVRAILLTGSGDSFCAGNDLEDFRRRAPGDEATETLDFMHALEDAAKPVVAAVNGVAAGIGVTLLMHCDLVYCADDAQLRLPFVTLGLCAEFASSLTLPLAAGYHAAAEKLLLGDAISPEEALAMRIVNRVLPRADVLPFARTQAARLAALPAASLLATKALLKRAWRTQARDVMDAEYAAFTRLLAGSEAQEALRAFFARHAPGRNA